MYGCDKNKYAGISVARLLCTQAQHMSVQIANRCGSGEAPAKDWWGGPRRLVERWQKECTAFLSNNLPHFPSETKYEARSLALWPRLASVGEISGHKCYLNFRSWRSHSGEKPDLPLTVQWLRDHLFSGPCRSQGDMYCSALETQLVSGPMRSTEQELSSIAQVRAGKAD